VALTTMARTAVAAVVAAALAASRAKDRGVATVRTRVPRPDDCRDGKSTSRPRLTLERTMHR